MENRRFTDCTRAAVAMLLELAALCALPACGGGGDGSDPSAAGAASATLTWIGPDSVAVAGYRVYYGLAPRSYLQAKGSGIAVERVESHVVTGLSAGHRYYFAVTAADANGNESAYSNEASEVVE